MLTAAVLCAAAVWFFFPDDALAQRGPTLHLSWSRPSRMTSASALSALAAELNAGSAPRDALLAVGEAAAAWPHAWSAAVAGSDISRALHEDDALVLAACWDVAGSSGAGLARAITRLAAFQRDADVIRAHLAAELAGPRASARMLAGLPLIGIGMGIAMGAEPLAFLLGSVPGLLCLGAGVTLTAVGLFWGLRIARGVERLL